MHGSRPRVGRLFASRLAVPLVIAAFLALPAPARGDAGSEADARSVARARAAIEAVDYDAALSAVRPLLGSPTAWVRASALEITAVADLLGGRLADGRHALEQLYTLAPAFLLDDPTLPPRVTSEFEAAAARPSPRAVTPILRPVEGEALRFELRPGGATRRVTVACRNSDGEPFVALATNEVAGAWRFDLPRASPASCCAVALDEEGLAIGRLGTTKSPFDVRPHPSSRASSRASASAPPSEGHAVTTRWWFWTGVAVVVIAGAAITYVATRPEGSSTLPRSEVTISALKGATISW